MKPGEQVKVRIEKPVYGGDFLAHTNGQAVFTPFLLPGEVASVCVCEAKRRFARAEAETLLTPSSARIQPACAHFGQCGGCHYQHTSPETQHDFKRAILIEALQREGIPIPAPVEILSAHPWAYRNRIRLAIDAADKHGSIGYRARSSRRLIPVSECPIAAPVLLPTAHRIAQWLRELGSLGNIDEMELMTTPTEDAVSVTLIARDSDRAAPVSATLEAMLAEIGPPLIGVALAVRSGEALDSVIARAGCDALQYPVAALEYSVPTGAFFQVNRWLLEPFRALVTAQERGNLAWDLFAGVGFFARALEAQFAAVTAVEGADASFASLAHSLTRPSSRAVHSSTLAYLENNRLQREPAPDFIVLDPPRAGLDARTCSLLAAIHAPRMTYVSCDPITLARDLKLLTAERFQIESIHLVDLFPQTYHIESVVKLARKNR